MMFDFNLAADEGRIPGGREIFGNDTKLGLGSRTPFLF
jgi:hypothetical protein